MTKIKDQLKAQKVLEATYMDTWGLNSVALSFNPNRIGVLFLTARRIDTGCNCVHCKKTTYGHITIEMHTTEATEMANDILEAMKWKRDGEDNAVETKTT